MMNDETTRRRDGNNNDGGGYNKMMATTTRRRRQDETVTNKKRGSGSRSICGRRETTQWWTKDNNDGGEGIGAMRLWPTTMAAGAPSKPSSPRPWREEFQQGRWHEGNNWWGGNGRKNGVATMTTTNMVPTKWHWRHGRRTI
jgi:hypothetical protein